MKNVIYKITSPSNKSYIGQTVRLKQRLSCYEHLRCKNQSAIYNAILKYGWENMKVEILWEKESKERLVEELNELEIKYIAEFNTKVPNGYNLTAGGKGHEVKDEHKRNQRIGILKSDINHFFNEEFKDTPLLNIETGEYYKNIYELVEKDIDKIKSTDFFYNLINCKYPYRFINTSISYPFTSGDGTLGDYYSKEDLEKIAEYGKTKNDLIKENKELKEIINKLHSQLNNLMIENYSLRENIN